MAGEIDRRGLLAGGMAATTIAALSPAQAATSEPALTRIAFGSCAHQDKEQPIWDRVNAWNPELFIFLGDNIYGDTQDMGVMRAKYKKLSEKPGFRTLRTNARCIATWDDHDYGVNDGGFEYPMKTESKALFLEFWNEPADGFRRSHDGLYTSYVFGPKGKRVQVILPDNRWFRTPLTGLSVEPEDRGQYFVNPDPRATMLGAEQWQWLEAELRKPADLRIFASSTQVLADQPGYEAWINFQADHQRLLDLIDFAQVENLVMISGDTHYAELSRLSDGVPYPLYDLTSSGLTQVWEVFGPNRNRIAKAPLAPNFGRLTIDWGPKDPAVLMEVQMLDGTVAISQRVPFAALKQG
ncbi:alkaline phosphatase D family protein [Sphingobium aquiterrae]|uniref:alkaline phosphatase D family protein n=1 Tax=Sphingobium aquiterrae TaxID=2038656 RepID=UPI003018A114